MSTGRGGSRPQHRLPTIPGLQPSRPARPDEPPAGPTRQARPGGGPDRPRPDRRWSGPAQADRGWSTGQGPDADGGPQDRDGPSPGRPHVGHVHQPALSPGRTYQPGRNQPETSPAGMSTRRIVTCRGRSPARFAAPGQHGSARHGSARHGETPADGAAGPIGAVSSCSPRATPDRGPRGWAGCPAAPRPRPRTAEHRPLLRGRYSGRNRFSKKAVPARGSANRRAATALRRTRRPPAVNGGLTLTAAGRRRPAAGEGPAAGGGKYHGLAAPHTKGDGSLPNLRGR